jgi:sarcosine oxidase subunit alpha
MRRAPISTASASVVGRKVGVYTASDSAYEAAFDLKRAGVTIAAIVDNREKPAKPFWRKPASLASRC